MSLSVGSTNWSALAMKTLADVCVQLPIGIVADFAKFVRILNYVQLQIVNGIRTLRTGFRTLRTVAVFKV